MIVTSSGFAFAKTGIDLATIGQFSGSGAYGGATGFSVGAESVSVTGWDGTTLQLTASAIPEPGSACLTLFGAMALAFRYRN